MVKTVVTIGDVHIGNDGAIQTEEVWTERDNPEKSKCHKANKIQLDMLRKWEYMCDEYHRPDLLVINGDSIDGKNYKDTGLGLWTTDVDVQADVFAELVSYLDPREIVATSGSPYHSDRNPNVDRLAAIRCCERVLHMNPEEAKSCFRGGYASINVNGCRMHFQHKVPTSKSTWQYRSTPLGRALVLADLSSPEYGHYDIVAKSHAHYFTYVGFSSTMGVILPCWKAYDPFGDTNIEFVNPAIGYCVFFVENDGTHTWTWDISHFKQSHLNPDVVI